MSDTPALSLSPSVQELQNAPTVAEIDGRTFVLHSYLWRDFQPVSPPEGKPLIAVVTVRATDGKPFPTELRVVGVWVRQQESVWSPAERDIEVKPAAPNANARELLARNGPVWGPGISVDVITALQSSAAKPVFLKAVDQPIHRTD